MMSGAVECKEPPVVFSFSTFGFSWIDISSFLCFSLRLFLAGAETFHGDGRPSTLLLHLLFTPLTFESHVC